MVIHSKMNDVARERESEQELMWFDVRIDMVSLVTVSIRD